MGHRVVAGTGEDIHVGFGEAEAGEDGSSWGAFVGLDFEFDLASAGGHFDEGSVGEAPGFDVVGVDFEGFLGEEVVDSACTSGLGPGVVSLEAASGGEPDGVVVVDDFGGVAVADDFEEARLAVFELVLMKNWGALVAFFGDGPLVVSIADVVPVEAFVDRAQAAEFIEDVLGGFVFESGGAEFFGNLRDDPPVWLGLAVTWDGFSEALDAALGVGLDVVGLAPSRGGEDDVGHLRGLGEEEVDDDEVVERLEGLLTVVFIRISDDGVFAIDKHGVDAIFFRSAEVEGGDLGHRVSEVHLGLLVELFKLLVELLRGDGLEAGVVAWDRSAVTCALNIILPTHRVDAGAFLAEVSGEEGEVAERLDVIDAADVLGDAEGVVDRAELGGTIPLGGGLDIIGWDFADFSSPSGSEFLEVGFEF